MKEETGAEVQALARTLGADDASFASWAEGTGVVRHQAATQVRLHELAASLVEGGLVESRDRVWDLLVAADRLTNAGMWLVVHMTYARNVHLDGQQLEADEFKPRPEGHTGGSLNMVPAYVGYLLANALTGLTRSWVMGQGHCVAAIDAINLLVGNMGPAHARRYEVSDAGLTRFVRDFYSYEIGPDGRPASPLGSHVNANTAGGLLEGGYLGFAELLHMHMPLRGERLVSFLSDGAFEEQRGSDWTPRWWRAGDCGHVVPVMIANGRRIDQRTTMSQTGGVDWLDRHLRLNTFDPFHVDGRDPAAFAWAILDAERRIDEWSAAYEDGHTSYPAPMPYVIAETIKGFGFPGAGTNRAHNLPLAASPASDPSARDEFNQGAKALWVPEAELAESVARLSTHERQARRPEREHPLAARSAPSLDLPEPAWRSQAASPMEGVDDYFCRVVRANEGVRVRVGNPDEMRSNRMNASLDLLKHRVTTPEQGVAEDLMGSVITALNEEAVVCAALGNKGGLNIAVTYEAFAVKMLGALRQEVIFARQERESGREPNWVSVPVVVTSHTWENGKNEQSHQDPTFCEALLGEMADASRVLFPADWNSACAALRSVYEGRGQVACMVVPKQTLPSFLEAEQATELARAGAVLLHGQLGSEAQLVAVGGYQLVEARRAVRRLEERGLQASLVYVQEPGRFRAPRDEHEAGVVAGPEAIQRIFGEPRARVLLTHTRPEALLGNVRPLDLGPSRTAALGYRNRGGTLDLFGMLFANRCTWAHAVDALAHALGRPAGEFLSRAEAEALEGVGDPRVLDGSASAAVR